MFVCEKCGMCCRHIDQIPELAAMHNGDGVCIHLTEDNLCDIYSTRPDICNVDRMYELRYKDIMPRETYDSFNRAGCRKVQEMNEIKNDE